MRARAQEDRKMKYMMKRNKDTITLDTETGKITGNTYGMKDVIKSDLYATWNAAEKCWESDKLAETVEEYKSYLTRCYSLKEVEESAEAAIEVKETAQRSKPAYRAAVMAKINGVCPYCHTYCYGDCFFGR